MTEKLTERDILELRLSVEKKDRDIAKLTSDLEKANARLKEATGQITTLNMTMRMKDLAKQAGVFETAAPDLVGRALREGEWIDDGLGNFYRKGKNGAADESLFDWLRGVKARSPYYAVDETLTEGQAATSTASTSPRAVPKEIDPELLEIFHPATMKLTKATEVYKKDPELAARIAEKVGNPLFLRLEQTRNR